MSSAVVAVEFVVLAEFLEHRFGAVHLIGGRVVIIVAENSQQRTAHFFSQIDRRNRALAVQVLGIVDNDITAPAIDRGIDTRERAGSEIGMPATGAEPD